MAILNNEALDDPLLMDACLSFAGGQVSVQRANLLQEGQCFELADLTISQLGGVKCRRGAASLGSAVVSAATTIQGLCWYDNATAQYLVAAHNGVLYKWNGSAWSTVSTYTSADATRDVAMVQGINLLYICDNNGHLFSWDGTSLVDLGYGGPNQPSIGKYLCWHTNRLFMAGISSPASVPDTLNASDLLDGATWKTNNSLRVGGGDSDPITGLCTWYNFNLVVGKRNSIWLVNTDPTATTAAGWTVQLVTKSVGCVSHRSMVQVDNDVLFLSDIGVVSMQRTAQVDNPQVGDALSFPIDDLIQRINWDSAHTSVAVVYNGLYLLSVPLDAATSPNYTLVYNIFTKSWSGYWTNWEPTCFAVSLYNNARRLNFGNATGHVMQYLDVTAPPSETETDYTDVFDADSEYDPFIRTRAMTFGDPDSYKKGVNVKFEFEGSSAAVVNLYVIRDNGADDVLEEGLIITPDGQILLPADLPFTFPNGIITIRYSLMAYDPFREVQFKVQSAGVGQIIKLRSVTVTAFMDTFRLE